MSSIGPCEAVMLSEDGLVLAPTIVSPATHQIAAELLDVWMSVLRILKNEEGGMCLVEAAGGRTVVLCVDRASWGMCGFAAALDQCPTVDDLALVRRNLQTLNSSLDQKQ